MIRPYMLEPARLVSKETNESAKCPDAVKEEVLCVITLKDGLMQQV